MTDRETALRLVELEVGAAIGAAHGERGTNRLARREGSYQAA